MNKGIKSGTRNHLACCRCPVHVSRAGYSGKEIFIAPFLRRTEMREETKLLKSQRSGALKWSVTLLSGGGRFAELDLTVLPEGFALGLKSELTGTGKWFWFGEFYSLKQPNLFLKDAYRGHSFQLCMSYRGSLWRLASGMDLPWENSCTRWRQKTGGILELECFETNSKEIFIMPRC